MRTEEINSILDLKHRIYGKKSGKICHYTSLESLFYILKNRSLRLTRYVLLNDKSEKELSKCKKGENRYIVSFTGTTKESVAMWSLYGKHSSIKVQIECSRGQFFSMPNDNFYFDSDKKSKIPVENLSGVVNNISKRSFTISDVIYFDKRRQKLKLSGKSLNEINVDEILISDFAGTIKYDAWEYERETRLSTILTSKEAIPTHIYLDLGEHFIENMTITFCPWVDDALCAELQKILNSVAGIELNYRKSELYGEIDNTN